MTAPNHLTGGIVFTGLFCSFFSVNIFASPVFITATLFGSILPDIDHTKSWIGKSFYPVAKYLSVNYGHRTITHSVFFLAAICIISLFVERNFREDYSITIILFFSVFSHFIFDMVTLQGIPLFYPFYKNPCVLPANPEMRIRSGNIRQEGIILFIFCFLSFFMQDLFKNGFWSTVNNNFNDVKHQVKEFKKSPNALKIDFDYSIYQEKYKGIGVIIQAANDNLYILSENRVLNIAHDTEGLKVNLLKSAKTNKKIHIIKLNIENYTPEKLNNLLKNKFISNGFLNASFTVATNKNNLDLKKKFKFENDYNIQIISSVNDTLQAKKEREISEMEIKIKTEQTKLSNSNAAYFALKNELLEQKNKLKNNLNNFELNETKEKIIELENKLQFKNVELNPMIEVYKKELQKIKNQTSKGVLISGRVNIVDIL